MRKFMSQEQAIMILILLLLAAMAVMLFCHIENKRFKITRYQISHSKITKDYTIVMLSDLHNYQYGENNQRLMAAIRQEKPDVVVSAGDMIEGSRHAPATSKTVHFLAQIASEFPFIYGMGNHESKLLSEPAVYRKTTEEFQRALQKEGKRITPLVDSSRTLMDSKIRVYGLDLEHEFFHKLTLHKVSVSHIKEKIGTPDPKYYNILIGHNPDQFDAYAKWGADLVLSGHVHGGMICFPWGRGIISPQFTLFPKYDHGIFKKGKTQMIVGRGLGNHTVHVRIFNRAELIVIHLNKQRNVD